MTWKSFSPIRTIPTQPIHPRKVNPINAKTNQNGRSIKNMSVFIFPMSMQPIPDRTAKGKQHKEEDEATSLLLLASSPLSYRCADCCRVPAYRDYHDNDANKYLTHHLEPLIAPSRLLATQLKKLETARSTKTRVPTSVQVNLVASMRGQRLLLRWRF
jgi:hypothetical protein